MRGVRNVLLTLGVTGLLVFGLLVLFPEPARAAHVTSLTPGPLVGDAAAAPGKTTGDFVVTQTIFVPPGQHMPVPSDARVLVAPKTATFAADPTYGDLVTGAVCDTSGAPTATIIDVTSSGSLTHSTFTGYGYKVDATDWYGYGYAFGYGTAHGSPTVDFSVGYGPSGYGYGYGYSEGVHVTVKILVSGCPLAGMFTGTSPAFDYFLVQTIVGDAGGGIAAGRGVASPPVTTLFLNPNATPSGTPLFVSDPTGLTLTGGALTSGSSLGPFTLSTGGKVVGMTVTGTGTLPVGSKIIIGTNNAPSAGTFNVGDYTSGGFLSGFTPAVHFQITVVDAAGNPIASPPVILSISLDIDPAYFTGGALPQFFKVVAYDASGTIKGAASQPSTTYNGLVGGVHKYTVTIAAFSSYAGGAGAATGGGGGGGGGTTTTTTTTSTSPVPPATPPATPPSTPPSTPPASETDTSTKGKKGRTPGLELPVIGLAVLGAGMLVRRRLQ